MSAPENNHRPSPSTLRRLSLLSIMVVCVALGLGFGAYWWFVWRVHVTTDDAYVGGNMISINSQDPGTVVAYYPDDGDLVEEGQLLVLLDTKDSKLAYEHAKTDLELAVTEVVKRQEAVDQAKALLLQARTKLETAERDYKSRTGLIHVDAVSKEEYEHFGSDVQLARASVDVAQHELDSALASLGPTLPREHPLIEAAKTRLREAYINLQQCRILSPVTGYVAKRHVQVGEWVNPGTPLMNVVLLDSLWVDANLKESQLEDVRIGQPVEIEADIYGSKVTYHAVVGRIQAGSGSAFSLLPPQNATGNWIKIVQRVPVRMYLNPEEVKKAPLVIGLSVFVDISVADTSGHFQPQEPTKERAAATDVYAFSMEPVEDLISQVLQRYFKSE